jgi:hypothetical protein
VALAVAVVVVAARQSMASTQALAVLVAMVTQ